MKRYQKILIGIGAVIVFGVALVVLALVITAVIISKHDQDIVAREVAKQKAAKVKRA